MPNLDEQLRVFNNQHPFQNELELIDSQRRTLIGDGRFEIPGQRAGLMARQGLVDIIEAQFGKELELTSKGRKWLREGQDEWNRSILASRAASKKTASRYHLPGKKPGTTIEFGIDRVFGRFFQYWPTQDEPTVDEDRLNQGEIVALMKQYGRPGADLDKATGALMLDLDPSKAGLRPVAASLKEGLDDDLLPYERAKAARFSEGPEGEKEWKAWFNQQPKSFQDEWKSENEKHRDQFGESMMAMSDKESCGGVPMGMDDDTLPYEEACGKPMAMSDEESCGAPMGGEPMMEKFDDAVVLPVEVEMKRLAEKTAANASGLYGYTKQTQGDVEATHRKAKKQAAQIARTLHAQDERSLRFLQTHAKRARSASARLLLSAMSENGLRVASSDRIAMDADQERLYDELWTIAMNDGRAYAKGDAEGAVKDAYLTVINNVTGNLRSDYRTIKSQIVRDLSDYWAETSRMASDTRTAAEKTSGIGMYGFPTKTARLCLNACTDLRAYIGEVAYDLHSRRTARWEYLTGFMREHAKTARCGYTRMLLGCYPDNPTDSPVRMASADWWEVDAEPRVAAKKVEVGDSFKDNYGAVWIVSEPDRGGTVHAYPKSRGEKFAQPFDVADLLNETRYKKLAKQKLPEELKDNQFTSEDNPNPKGNDRDGDGKTNEKKPFKEAAADAPKPGDVVVVEVFGKEREGKVKKVHSTGDMADVDFGGGDVYGITFKRMTVKKAAVSASDIKPGDEVMVGKFRGKVERVRDVDAWVELEHGASWVPLKNITLPSGKKAENRNKTMRDQLVKSLGSGASPEGSVNVLAYKGKEWKIHWPRLESPGGDLVELKSRKDDAWLDEAIQHIKGGGKKADFDPNEISENEPGALVSDSDEPYMKGNFTEQETSELSDKMAAAPSTVAGWLEWQE
jgi:hypothetical protein